MITTTKVIEFKCARWKLPNGTYYSEQVPIECRNSHFGPELRKHIIYQHHVNRVTQTKIYQELKDKGIDISVGQIDAILASEAKNFAQEKEAILPAAIKMAKVIQTDDTGSRHKGKNGFCTVLCNDRFAYFKTTDSKSRINFLKILNANNLPYMVNDDAIAYAKKYGLGQENTAWLASKLGTSYIEHDFENFFKNRAITNKNKRIITEACLLAACFSGGLAFDQIIVSDGARQFNILKHALCWIHADRALKKIVPINDEEKIAIDEVRELTWHFYDELKKYRKSPSLDQKIYLTKKFDQIFSMSTYGNSIAPILASFRKHKDELLLVLEHPEVPLHNNTSERDIRDYVIKRKISGGTRSDLGREARDIFTSLIKTCFKNKISFWVFLDDRIKKINTIPQLAQTIAQQASGPSP